MRLLELCSGTGSVGRPWREAGHEVISVDIDGKFGAEIVQARPVSTKGHAVLSYIFVHSVFIYLYP